MAGKWVDTNRRRDPWAVAMGGGSHFEQTWEEETHSSGGNYMAQQALVDAADDFFDEWTDSKDKLNGYYSGVSEAIEGVEGMADTYASELNDYKTQFDPTKQKFLDMTDKDFGRRDEMANSFMEFAKPQYNKVSGDAMADVAHQSQIGRESADRAMQGMGINPASGNYQSQQRQGRIQEAANKALAANTARQGETARAAAMAGKGVELFDPNKSVQGALQIQGGQDSLLAGQGNMLATGAQLRGDQADSYGRNVTLPAGETAGALYGAVAGLATGGDSNSGPSGGRGGGNTTTYGPAISGMNPNYDQESKDFFGK
jgi:hypothetical protein